MFHIRTNSIIILYSCHEIYITRFEKPSKIQETALPLLLRNPPENLIGQAQSGSGKTVAFCMGVLNRVDTRKNVPQVRYMIKKERAGGGWGWKEKDRMTWLNYTCSMTMKLRICTPT